MSALEELWLWLQGRNSQTEAGPDTGNAAAADRQREAGRQDANSPRQQAERAARSQRNWRYRAGPWQMK